MNAAIALKQARIRARLSQAALSRRSGVSQPTISRIERGAVDPGWHLMTSLLSAAGTTIGLERDDESAHLISADQVSREIRHALRRNDEPAAIRDLTEAAGRLQDYIHAHPASAPRWVFAPAAPTGADEWDTIIAGVYGWLGHRIGQPVPWADQRGPLDHEIVLGDRNAPEATRERIRRQTPEYLRSKGVLVRERDLEIA